MKYLICLCSLIAFQSLGQNNYNIYRTPGSVTIDGNLTEWSNVPYTSNFVIHNSGNTPSQNSKAQMMWDDNNIYFAFQASDNNLTGTVSLKDGKMFDSDDVFEIFIDPDGNGTNYIEFGVNVKNANYDYIIICNGSDGGCGGWSDNQTFNLSGLETAINTNGGTLNNASDTDNGWTLEIKVPFAAFNAISNGGFSTPSNNTSWNANLYRIDYQTGGSTEYQSWQKLSSFGYHKPIEFGKLTFMNAPLNNQNLTLESNNISVAPLPIIDNTFILTTPLNTLSIDIYNQLGSLIYTQSLDNNNTKHNIDLKDNILTRGTYTAKLTLIDGTYSFEKIIIE